MARRQIDCDVVPIDTLADNSLTKIDKGSFAINGERFKFLVVPFAQRLPLACLRRLAELARAGVPVIFTGDLPVAASDAEDAPAEIEQIRSHPAVVAGPEFASPGALERLAEEMLSSGLADVRVSPASPHLRMCHYRRGAMDLWFCVNEDPRNGVDADVRIREARVPFAYEAMADAVWPIAAKREGDEVRVRLQLAPYSSLFLVFADGPGQLAAALESPAAGGARPTPFVGDLRTVAAIEGPWTVSTATADKYPTFTPRPGITVPGDLSLPGKLRGFGGIIAYETAFRLPAGSDGELWLDLGELHQISEPFLDGRPLGVRICPPHVYDLGKVAAGEHRVRIEVTTTLVEPLGDANEFDRSMAQKPMGLLGPVRVLG
jgi:hypothetical protein